ncbi:MAG TPA: response regulator [Ignavibacteriaceae bacterium]|jgi:CheY-like chemotaxis protein|nr:response regulator [Ignavibacteriaceae bacterium]
MDDEKTSFKKILIVEDDALTRDIMKRQLDKFYRIDFAVDGKEALDLFEQNNYALILMDINLGIGKNGIEVMKEIRKSEKGTNTAVVAITAYGNFGDKESFIDAGFDNYISKPWNTDSLVRCMMDTISMYD